MTKSIFDILMSHYYEPPQMRSKILLTLYQIIIQKKIIMLKKKIIMSNHIQYDHIISLIASKQEITTK
jgi:hypothetical protein